MLPPILDGWLTGFSIWFGGSIFSGVAWLWVIPLTIASQAGAELLRFGGELYLSVV